MDELKDNLELQKQVREIIKQELERIGFGSSVGYLSPAPCRGSHPQGMFQIESEESIKNFEHPPYGEIIDTVKTQLGVTVPIECVPSGTDITDWSPYSQAG